MKLWPTRQKHKAELVADLDAMVSDPVAFILHGKTYVIKPIELEEFLKYTNAYSKLMNATSDNVKLSNEKLIDAYFDLFSSVCPEITKEDIKKMSHAQVGALFQLISDCITGKALVDEKKTLQRAMKAAEIADQYSTQ